jgi:hypothetical protein
MAELRSLIVTSPLMTGDDVKRLQKKLGIDPDGEYGPITATAVHASKRVLGFLPSKWDTGASVFYQEMLFGKRATPADYKARAKKAADQDAKAAKKAAAGQSGRTKAAAWLIERAGRHEGPVQNRADWLDKWQIANGHPAFRSGSEEGWPWCGVACWSAHKWGTGVVLDGRMRSTDWIFTASASNTSRLSRVPLSKGKKGDLVLLFARGEHVGMLAADYKGGPVQTIEGNTSSGTSGSQSNGGGVYQRTRKPSDVIAVVRVTV